MTVGSYVRDRTSLVANRIDGALQGTTSPSGSYRSKTWNGADSPKRTDKAGYVKRYYTVPVEYEVVDRKGRRKVIKKVSTRSFREYPPRKRDAYKVPNAYTMTGNNFEYAPIRYYHDVITKATGATTNRTIYDGYIFVNFPGWVSLTANDQIELVNKLREQMRGSDFNLAVFLGEGHQSLKLIADSAIKIAEALTYVRKGNVIKAADVLRRTAPDAVRLRAKPTRELKTVSSNWLELQWGWLPLLGDMKTGAEQLAHRLNVPFRQRIRARIKKRQAIADSPYVGLRAASLYSTAHRQIVATVSEPLSLPALSGMLDPELVAWELLPFSWMADYVAPIGDYLAARSFANRLSGVFVTSNYDVVRCQGLTESRADFGATFTKTWAPNGNPGDYSWFRTNRTVSTVLDVPMPVVKPLNKILSWRHCANSIAALSQIVLTGKVSPTLSRIMGNDVKSLNQGPRLGRTRDEPYYWPLKGSL